MNTINRRTRFIHLFVACVLLVSVLGITDTASAIANAATSNAPITGMAATRTGKGYWQVASDGGIFAFGDAGFYGSMGGKPVSAPIIGMTPTPSSYGYWLVARDGGVFAFGNARFYGSMGGQYLAAPVVGIAATPTGKGYWLTAADGGIFAFGDAMFFGSIAGEYLAAPVVGIAATPTGKGYWLTAADGGIFAFGDAGFYGSMGGQYLAAPVVGIAATRTGAGYWLTAADGGIFAFGDAGFYGSMGGQPLNGPVVGITPHPLGTGYWLTAADGGVFAFGAAKYYGSMPYVGVVAQPQPNGLPETIVLRAKAELRKGFVETNGNNCNPYSSYYGTGCVAWCADFARYVWQMANARTSWSTGRLDAGAISFYRYGQAQGTFRKTNPRPGDAVVFSTRTDTAKHVGIVIAVHSPTSITMISGNRSNKVASDTFDPTINTLWGPVLGFASPVSN